MAPTPDPDLRLLDKRLELLRKRDHIPAELLDLVGQVCARQLRAVAEADPGAPPQDRLAAQDTHIQGAPLLAREHFPYDAAQARALFEEFLRLLLERPGPMAEAASVAAGAVAAGDPALERCFAAHLQGDEEFFDAFGRQRTPQAPRTLAFLVQSALAPSLAAVARALGERHDTAKAWPHPHCPICGSAPLMGELREKEGLRYAACSFCRTSYRMPRLRCAFCGETDHARLSYFTADDEQGYRVDVCDTCKHYIKTTDFRKLDKRPLPLLDDLESLSLDILAANEGYNRPTLSGFGF
ncbi:formate dehydrogenase accessory protein FdhE [Desulfocurvus vexinensis]|uniref:formate dehydrogenase accessory protein FdhE n=1 Tax=Desulfocurvus vexinensis TaxID=399548 RepID=UPI00048C1FDC|nr:formate dehydrogenase accessory protein FdhE [Desulfocurvus vexinensis]